MFVEHPLEPIVPSEPNVFPNLYSFTLVPPTTNILVPSAENANPSGIVVSLLTLKESTNEQVDTSKAVHVYSLISSPSSPPTNIFVPSVENSKLSTSVS